MRQQQALLPSGNILFGWSLQFFIRSVSSWPLLKRQGLQHALPVELGSMQMAWEQVIVWTVLLATCASNLRLSSAAPHITVQAYPIPLSAPLVITAALLPRSSRALHRSAVLKAQSGR